MTIRSTNPGTSVIVRQSNGKVQIEVRNGSVDLNRVNAKATGALSQPVDLNRLKVLFQNHPDLSTMLDRLDARGALNTVDQTGTPLDERLAMLASMRSPKPGWPSGVQMAAHVVEHLHNPGCIQQGKGTLSCAAAVAQGSLAASKPADYARMVFELATRGESRTLKGDVVKADWRGISRSEGRDPVEDLLQESLLAFGEQSFPDAGQSLGGGLFGAIGNRIMKVVSGIAKGVQKLARRLGGSGGDYSAEDRQRALPPRQLTSITDSLTGEARATLNVHHPSAEDRQNFLTDPNNVQRRVLEAILRESLRAGPVPLGITGQEFAPEDMGHAISLVAIQGQEAIGHILDPGDGKIKPVPFVDLLGKIENVALPHTRMQSPGPKEILAKLVEAARRKVQEATGLPVAGVR